MTVIAPERDQRLDALALANEIRFKRARLKKRIAVNPKLAAGLVWNPPEWALTMKVETVLQALPKVGPAKIGKMLKACEIASSKTVGGLSDRQRDRLDLILTKKAVASRFEISIRSVERHIKPSVRVGGQNRYYLSDVERQLHGVPSSGGTVVPFPTKRGEAA
jgi:DNA-binding CsgD family transcriptional regulator